MSEIASQLLEFPPEIPNGNKLSPEEYDKRVNDFLSATLDKLSTTKIAEADAEQDLLQVRFKLQKLYQRYNALTILSSDLRSCGQQSIIPICPPTTTIRNLRQTKTLPSNRSSCSQACYRILDQVRRDTNALCWIELPWSGRALTSDIFVHE